MPALSISKQAGNVARQVTRRDARRSTAGHAFSALSELKEKESIFFVFGENENVERKYLEILKT